MSRERSKSREHETEKKRNVPFKGSTMPCNFFDDVHSPLIKLYPFAGVVPHMVSGSMVAHSGSEDNWRAAVLRPKWREA